MKYLVFCIVLFSGCNETSHRELYDKVTAGCINSCKPDRFLGKIQVHPEHIGCICE